MWCFFVSFLMTHVCILLQNSSVTDFLHVWKYLLFVSALFQWNWRENEMSPFTFPHISISFSITSSQNPSQLFYSDSLLTCAWLRHRCSRGAFSIKWQHNATTFVEIKEHVAELVAQFYSRRLRPGRVLLKLAVVDGEVWPEVAAVAKRRDAAAGRERMTN